MKKARKVTEESRLAPKSAAKPRGLVDFWICLALLFATIVVYAPVGRFDFVNFDDPDYVSRNPHVRRGVSPDGVAWALTSGDAANWFPVTRLSHMVDVQLFGLDSGRHHLMNVAFHALASLFLFLFLNRATAARWPSAFVAFIFALHPLHVESVAWITERKDVLSGCFWFLALWIYVLYAERPSIGRYLAVFASFCLGLMAKPTMVTLPFVLLLLDVWPLRRISRGAIREKIPFFATSAAAAVVTYLVQHAAGAVKATASFPIALRTANAFISYAVYIMKTFWPTWLAVFYPYRHDISGGAAALAAVALAAVSAAAIYSVRSRPYIAVGWFWFLGTLVPVIGLVQVGAQARADRYMYIPLTGLAIMVAWGARDILQHGPRAKWVVATFAAAACMMCAVLTHWQLDYWRNSETLFRHALDVAGENYLAEHNLGNALLQAPGRSEEAISHLKAALKIDPDSVEAHTDLATALTKAPGGLPDAIAEYRIALRLNPDSAISRNNMGNALVEAGRIEEAIAEYQSALRAKPDYAEAHNNFGIALEKAGRPADAIPEFQTALRIDPDYAEARRNLTNAQTTGSAETHYQAGIALSKAGRFEAAIEEFQTALRINPSYPEAHNNLGVAFTNLAGPPDRAIAEFEAALRVDPDYADAHYNLGVALSQIGRTREAIAHLESAQRIKPDPELKRAIDRLRTSR